jgi:hypothetical protein
MFMKTPAVLKTLAAVVLLGAPALLGLGGCADNKNTVTDTDWVPGYSFVENGQRVNRYYHYDAEQFMDDVDRDLFMIRPSSKLTWWNVEQSD